MDWDEFDEALARKREARCGMRRFLASLPDGRRESVDAAIAEHGQAATRRALAEAGCRNVPSERVFGRHYSGTCACEASE